MRIYQKQLPATRRRCDRPTDWHGQGRRNDRKFRALLPCLTLRLSAIATTTTANTTCCCCHCSCLAHMEGGKAGGRGREQEQNMGKSVCDSATLFEGDHNLYGFLDCPTLVMCTSFSFSPSPSSRTLSLPSPVGRPECLAYKMPLNLVASIRSKRHPQSPSLPRLCLL